MRKIVATADGSSTIFIENTGEQYHSSHGAVSEAQHVYIQAGLNYLAATIAKPILLFEMGFGTGLNCFLTYLESLKKTQFISYTTVEAYPIDVDEVVNLNYADQFQENQSVFQYLHHLSWEDKHAITTNFHFQKIHSTFQSYKPLQQFNLVYYDAFGARTQPELWDKQITDKLFHLLQVKGVLVTFSVYGEFRRNLLDSGFFVEKISGPPGKREMLRAIKLPC